MVMNYRLTYSDGTVTDFPPTYFRRSTGQPERTQPSHVMNGDKCTIIVTYAPVSHTVMWLVADCIPLQWAPK